LYSLALTHLISSFEQVCKPNRNELKKEKERERERFIRYGGEGGKALSKLGWFLLHPSFKMQGEM